LKVLVIYDSRTGNTEEMARAITEGAASVEGTETEVKKVGQPFSLTALADADAVAFGSPVIYADITGGMRDFLECVKLYIEAGKMNVEGKRAAVFGSYGYDGAWIMEDRLKRRIGDLGYAVQEEVCVETDSNLRYHPATPLEKCRAFGKDLAESLNG